MIHEYSTAGWRFCGSRILPWGQLVSDLHTNCSSLNILKLGDNKGSLSGSSEETSAWPPLLQLQILRFIRAPHKAVNTFLSRINAPNLKVVELVGTSICPHDNDQTAAIADVELHTIELPPGVNRCLRFKHSTLKDIHD
ncbi:hypothetical protein M407DRAFT_33968 [Tulasnella calospora MUT 4182]|uniref:Uncharacterized protein n=1 Tax=Tulasnella calospora MUT 4182 TaxID=1051891 RepID=A0A0C3PPG1_9AGAM|nr:hypothetical protein M407DRAFT_33968 [Tulasnella calospora MUT 4182]